MPLNQVIISIPSNTAPVAIAIKNLFDEFGWENRLGRLGARAINLTISKLPAAINKKACSFLGQGKTENKLAISCTDSEHESSFLS